MIAFFVGTPGSGKSYEAVKKIIDNLRLGRVVCTNIDGMEIEEHQRYLQNITGLDDFKFKNNFIFLNRDDVLRFWKTVEYDDLTEVNGEIITIKKTRKICPSGSLIIIDEAHKPFNSRDWQKQENKELGDWASTHRHEGYDVVFITQDIDKVDKQVRTLTEWTYFFRKVNFLGGAVQKKYLCYSYSGDEHRGTPLSKNVRTYDARIFPAYKSYSVADAKEVGFMTHVNILKHPVFFLIPIVLLFTIYMFSKSSLASGDLFGLGNRKPPVVASSPSSVPAPVSPSSDLAFKNQSSLPVVSSFPDDNKPDWRFYHVQGYIRSGLTVAYLVNGVVLNQSACRNYSPSFKTVECFGPLIPASFSVPVPVSVHDEKETPEKEKQHHPENSAGQIVAVRSVAGSDEKVEVVQ